MNRKIGIFFGRNIRTFISLGLESSVSKYKKIIFFGKKKKNFKLRAQKFHFPKYKKKFFLDKYQNFFRVGLFSFLGLGLENVPASPIIYCCPNYVLLKSEKVDDLVCNLLK